MYLDAYAIIVQKDMDGGDSLHREAMYAFAIKLRENELKSPANPESLSSRRPASFKNNLDIFEVAPGVYIRHPDPNKWYSNPETTSRDQLFPVIAYCAAYEDTGRLWRLFKAVARRGFFAQNWIRIGQNETAKKIPDPMHFNIAQFIRAGGWYTAPLYPLLFLFDGLELMGTIVSALPLHFRDDHLWPRWKNGNDVDDNNLVVQHLLAAHYKPTPFSALSRYIYSVTRARNFGNTKLGERNAVMGAISWYHRSEFGGEGNPEIAEAYRPLIDEYFDYPTPQEALAGFLKSVFSRAT